MTAAARSRHRPFRRRLLAAGTLAGLGGTLPSLARAAAGCSPATLRQGLQRSIASDITGQRYRIS